MKYIERPIVALRPIQILVALLGLIIPSLELGSYIIWIYCV